MRFIKTILFLLIASFASAPGVLGQDEDAIRVDTDIVNVSVSVTDKNGNRVDGLKKDDFELFDNKKKTEIAFFSNQDAPLSYGIVYDLHPSTAEQTAAILRSLEAFTDALGENEDFFLTVFNEYGSLNINFVPTLEQIRRHLSFGERNKPNSLYDAVFYAGEKLRARANQKRALIIISDGKDDQSHHSFSELERLLDSFSVQIYGVILDEKDMWDYDALAVENDVVRSRIDESALDKAAIRALSVESGGNSMTPQARNTVELFKIFERISNEARVGYSLGFYPAGAGSHKIEIKLKKKNSEKVHLTYRKSYRLLKKP